MNNIGWLSGCFMMSTGKSHTQQMKTVLDGTNLPSSSHGLPVTREWLEYIHVVTSVPNSLSSPFLLSRHPTKAAQCIVVIEKEGIYQRLIQSDPAFPCIFITGKGYPDLATRACLASLHATFPDLPIIGICDCNPFGLHVLETYRTGGGEELTSAHERKMYYSCPALHWKGLLPSDVERLSMSQRDKNSGDKANLGSTIDKLPPSVFQALTKRDHQKLNALINRFGDLSYQNAGHKQCINELQLMRSLGYKLELESLYWLGVNFLHQWFEKVLLESIDTQ